LKGDRLGIAEHKSPIASTNHQWVKNKTPTDGSFTLFQFFIVDFEYCRFYVTFLELIAPSFHSTIKTKIKLKNN
jgi:hypothetical protein